MSYVIYVLCDMSVCDVIKTALSQLLLPPQHYERMHIARGTDDQKESESITTMSVQLFTAPSLAKYVV